MGFNSLQVMMVGLIFLMEMCMLGMILKEVYDLLFLPEGQRKFELEQNRKMYWDRDKENILADYK